MEIMKHEMELRMKSRGEILRDMYNHYFKTEGKTWWKPSNHDFETKSALNYLKDLNYIKGEDNIYMITTNGIKSVEAGVELI